MHRPSSSHSGDERSPVVRRVGRNAGRNLVTLAVLLVMRVPVYFTTPLAVGVGVVADEPNIKRLLFAALAVTVVIGVLYWQQRE